MDFFSILTLIGGLGLFLFGMNMMGDHLKKLAGGKLEMILSKLTANNFMGFLLGFFVTAVIQSSAATIVMLVGFANSGIMVLGQTIGIIAGANVGTTVTAWILSLARINGESFILKMFTPTSFTPVLMGVGVIMSMVCKTDKNKNLAGILIGFSILMFGMITMSDAMSGLNESPAFGHMLIMFSNPVMGIIIGTLLTAVIQSSSASVGILQAMSLTGAIPYATAIPIILGQNIGASVTPILSAITGKTEGKRVALACLYIKIIGVVVVGFIFYALNAFFRFAFMEQSIGMVEIAVVHTLFNILATIVILPFAKGIEKLTVMTLKGNPEDKDRRFDVLDEKFLSIPSFAIERSRELVCEMANMTNEMVKSSISLIDNYDYDIMKRLQENEEFVDLYEDKISTFLVKVASANPSTKDSEEITELLHCIGEFERISDHAVNIGDALPDSGKWIDFSPNAKKELKTISDAVCDILSMTISAFTEKNLKTASQVEPLEQVIDELRSRIKANHVRRLQNGRCSIEVGLILNDLLNNFERIADHCSNVAVCLLEIAHGSFEIHEYLNVIKTSDGPFVKQYQEFMSKYAL